MGHKGTEDTQSFLGKEAICNVFNGPLSVTYGQIFCENLSKWMMSEECNETAVSMTYQG